MFAQEPPPDFDGPGRREPGERPELVAEVGLVEVACATGEVAPVESRRSDRPYFRDVGARSIRPTVTTTIGVITRKAVNRETPARPNRTPAMSATAIPTGANFGSPVYAS